jgi:hypothetical protein
LNYSHIDYISIIMSKKVRKVKRVSDEIFNPNKPSPKVKLPKNRKMSEVLGKPVKHPEESKLDTKRRWRMEEELLRACISEGMSRSQIRKTIGVRETELCQIEKRLLANEGQPFINQSTAHRFYTYTLQQEQCVRDLEHVLSIIMSEMDLWATAYKKKVESGDDEDDEEGSGRLPPKPSSQAAVMAIKAKSELFDRTIKMGQELGLIEKRAKELRVSGNLNLAALPTEELRIVLSKKLKEFEKLVGEGKLPTVYERMIQTRTEPHAKANSRGRDGSNLDTDFDPVSS